MIEVIPKYATTLSGLIIATCLATATAASAQCDTGINMVDALPEAQRQAIFQEAATQANGKGRFYRIEKADKEPSYLFGTVHLTDPRVTYLPESISTAFDSASQLVLETTDLIDSDALEKILLEHPDLTTLPEGQRITDYLSSDDTEALTRLAQNAGTPLENFATLQPWLVAAAVMTTPCEQQRQAEGKMILDLTLAQKAEGMGKPIAGLESASEQFGAMASLPYDHQAEMLLATFKFQNRIPDIIETLISLYLQGNIAVISPALELIAPAGSDEARSLELWKEFDERIIRDRNRLMADRLQPALTQGGAFVAVGAQHLIGDEGLVELLRDAGWTLSPVAE
ncbi:hypothetical protein FPY71_18320 [Aureimonas fodinaquatilis]|uniref:TraB/GumN family protein n=1 Tax=Aureimonas fodinaquatilis TaxID=2565783 RepID=A0A5B0DPB3_9HYPH|nr:TraB/GumN family protein [Aureimonas fodinaquatilis]KAA0968278.1 hypothetical protein FPY71_18320 [Aureimonas fodinaquatilis]